MSRCKVFNTALCIVALFVLFLGGCNKAESTPDEVDASTQNLSTTVVETTILTSIKETESLTERKTETEQIYVPATLDIEQEEEPQICTVNVDGEAYTCYVGDTINYVFYLKTPEALEDFQATTNYDSGMLKLTKTEFPVAGSEVVCNTDMPNAVKFNAVNINGMDFTNGGYMVSLEFEVLDSGFVAIGTTVEYMDSLKGEPYVSDYKIIGDIEYSEEIN